MRLNILIQLLLGGIAVLITQYILPGVHVADFLTGIIVAALLSLLNLTVKPLLIILTIPITILTLGPFPIGNQCHFDIVAAEIIPGFSVDGFWWALCLALILSLINSFLGVSLGGK
jgi:putative membrane protein